MSVGRKILIGSCIAVPLGIFGSVIGYSLFGVGSKTEGGFEMRGPAGSTWVEITACETPQPPDAPDVTLWSAGGDSIRAYTDESGGTALSVAPATAGRPWQLGADDCSTLRLDFVPTATQVESTDGLYLRLVDGALEVDCTVEDRAVRGSVRFSGCR